MRRTCCPKARGGYRLGHGQVLDHMFLDGLEDAYDKETRGRLWALLPRIAPASFSREAQDGSPSVQRRAPESSQQRRQLRLENRPGDRQRPQGRHIGRQG